jgi:hypothetical protein
MDAAVARLPLFAYGSLVDADVFFAVSGLDPRRLRIEPARLRGCRLAPVRGMSFPTLIPASSTVAHGLLYHGLGARAYARISWFEGDLYRLERRVVAAAGGPVGAVLYLTNSSLAAPGTWSFEAWQRDAKARALPAIRARMSEFEGVVAKV